MGEEWVVGRKSEDKVEWLDEWIFRWMDGWTVGQMDAQRNGGMNEQRMDKGQTYKRWWLTERMER